MSEEPETLHTMYVAHDGCCGCINIIESPHSDEILFSCNECGKEIGRAEIPGISLLSADRSLADIRRERENEMATNNLYRVTYHFETSGKKVSEVFQDNVLAANSDFNTIAAVLSSNSKTNGGHGSLVIVSVGHIGGASGILS